MTNLQFMSLLIPAAGSFVLVVLAWLHQNTRLTDLCGEVHRGFDQMGLRLDKVETHLGRIDQDLRNFHGTDKELEGRINEISARIK